MSGQKQLQLFEAKPRRRSAQAWGEELSLLLERPVALSYGRARHNVVVAKSVGAGLQLRLNEHFASAPEEVCAALAAWLKHGQRARRASATLDAWIEQLNQRLGESPRQTPRIRQAGRFHQLEALALEVLEAHFARELGDPKDPNIAWQKRVTWGRRGTRRARRSIQLGSYDSSQRLIRVHPVLDQRFVPCFFLRYVLFHEFLHAALDKRTAGGPRERPHPPAFQIRERAYPEFERATAWQKSNLRTLLNSARTLA